jgi:hypothetical protein
LVAGAVVASWAWAAEQIAMSPSSFGTTGRTGFLRFKMTSAIFVWFLRKQHCRTLAAKIATSKKF